MRNVEQAIPDEPACTTNLNFLLSLPCTWRRREEGVEGKAYVTPSTTHLPSMSLNYIFCLLILRPLHITSAIFQLFILDFASCSFLYSYILLALPHTSHLPSTFLHLRIFFACLQNYILLAHPLNSLFCFYSTCLEYNKGSIHFTVTSLLPKEGGDVKYKTIMLQVLYFMFCTHM